MTGQFALFAGEKYYPEGGFRDLACVGSRKDCELKAAVMFEDEGSDWAHIVDLATMKIITYSVADEQKMVWLEVPRGGLGDHL